MVKTKEFHHIFGKFLSLSLSSLLLFSSANAESISRVIKINDLNLSQSKDAAKFEQRLSDVVNDFCAAERGMRERRVCQEVIRREALDQLSQTQRDRLRVAEAGTPLSASIP